ncbi:hypothetical protein DFJ77DRAFT_209820 [Powellomyces hirtus]|nr:hypothetical protein DFJ77DRAFT_209820 [Powellomyces hirtus]
MSGDGRDGMAPDDAGDTRNPPAQPAPGAGIPVPSPMHNLPRDTSAPSLNIPSSGQQPQQQSPPVAPATLQPPPSSIASARGETPTTAPSRSSRRGGGADTAGTTGAGEDNEPEDFYLGGLFNLEVSPGYRFLEGLRGGREHDENLITHLKDRTHSLHAFLLSCAEYEKQLMKRCKDVNADVQKLRLEIDRTASKQFTENTEIGELKRELLKAENEVKLAKERESKLEKDIEESQEKKKTLTEDIDEIRRHKADMLEPQLIASSKELKR